MKRFILSVLGGTLCIFLVILTLAAHETKKEAEPIENKYISALQGECFLCGDGSDPIISHYWGEDNVGIINLNTFELLRLEINRYNDHGQLLGKVAGYMQSSHLSGEESYVHACTFPDNGYAHVQISGVKYELDRSNIQESLCQRCLDTINNLVIYRVVPAEYAIINFADRAIHPLMSCYSWISTGNYDIDCEFENNASINLVINYRPTQIN